MGVVDAQVVELLSEADALADPVHEPRRRDPEHVIDRRHDVVDVME